MTQPAKFVVQHPKLIIATTIVITVGFLAAILTRGVTFNGSPETLARKDAALEFYHQSRKTFGDDRVILVALTTTQVFTPEFMTRLDRLTRRIAAVDGVAETISLTNIKSIRSEDRTVSVDKLIPSDLISGDGAAERLARIGEEITRDPLYAKQYISTDGRTAAINVFLKPMDESQMRATTDSVERLAKSDANGDELLLSGVPVIEARGVKSMFRDMNVLSPVAGVLCFLAFLLAFRTFWGAVLPMAAILIGLVWSIGLMSLLDRPITLATLSLPTTLMAVGSSYFFHVLNQYRISMSIPGSASSAEGKRDAWLDGLSFISPAVIVSGTATMAGFGALASSAVPTARDMGIFEALGVGGMLMLTLLFIPAALALLPPDALGLGTQKDYATWLDKPLRNFTALILFRRRTVLVLFLLATLAIGVGAFHLKANTDYLKIFPAGSETVQAAEKLHERLAGAATVQLVVSDTNNDARTLLTAVDKLERFALTRPGVDAAISIADIVKRMNRVLPGKPGEMTEEIPKDDERLRSMMRDYLSQDESLSRLITSDGKSAMMVLRINMFGSTELRGLTRAIDDWSAANLPAGVTQQATGSIILLNDASDAVAASQSSSLLIALVSIYLMMVVTFRSFATALLALIPNLLPIVAYFGFLGWSGTSLDITTSLVASAVLGLAVDNAVHMIRRYRQSIVARTSSDNGSAHLDEGWVMWLTMLRTGKPMVLANLMLIAAFLIFVLSSFVPVRSAGVLWALTILACLAADLIFLPALMKTRLFERVASGGVAARQDRAPETPALPGASQHQYTERVSSEQ
ncbi:MAG TPA: MMPL family transporter [Blastocatellia bacterium]|nr:MMPL family transporter [Blastocatellia bacterium]